MPKKLETAQYTVLNARRIAGKRRDVDDVVDLAPGTADHLVASGDVELASLTPARKAAEAQAAAGKLAAEKAAEVTGFEAVLATMPAAVEAPKVDTLAVETPAGAEAGKA